MPLERGTRNDKILVDCVALCKLFEHARLSALKTTLKLEVLIADLKLDERPSEADATKEGQLMPALNLLTGLSLDLLIVEHLKLVLRNIRSNQNSRTPPQATEAAGYFSSGELNR
jgi:hypothetical protein